MNEEQGPEIMEVCHYINEKCQIDDENFTMDTLKQPYWYLEVMSTICPYLEAEIEEIHSLEDTEKAIYEILRVINDLDEFHENVLEVIDSKEVMKGNIQHIQYMVQIFHTLLQSAINQPNEEASDSPDQQKHQQQIQNQSAPCLDEMEKSIAIEPSNIIIPPFFESRKQVHQEHQISERQSISKSQSKREEFSPIFNSTDQDVFPQFTSVEEKESSPHFFENPKPMNEYQVADRQFAKKYQKLQQEINKKKKILSRQKQKSKNKKKPSDSLSKIHNHLKKVKSSGEIKLFKNSYDRSKEGRKIVKKNSSLGRTKVQDKKSCYVMPQMKKPNKDKKPRLSGKLIERKSEKKLNNILKWKDEKVRKQRKSIEVNQKNKIQLRKEQYIQKVNDLLLKLEKEKEYENDKDFKEKLVRENHEAVKRMIDLEKWYKQQVNRLKKNRKSRSKAVNTEHKGIVGQLKKQMKNENEKRLINLTQQYREQQGNILEELDHLEKKIMRVYKNH